MQKIDVTKKVTNIIKFGLIGLVALALATGSGVFYYQNRGKAMQINNAKVAGTMVSVRVLTNGKIKELTFADGDEVKAGDVIAKIEISITEDEIKQLENTVDLTKKNYVELQKGQMVKIPVPKPKAVPASESKPKKPKVNLASLEERKNRMEMLFEMGAISKVQRDAAIKEYELAKTANESSIVEVPAERQQSSEIEIEYVEQLQPTPPEVLEGAKLAVKQAEISLNVAKQEAQQTDVIAPVDGTIYYNIDIENEVKAGDSIAKVGDSNELWLEAEVTEDQFDKLSLGRLVSYVIDGNVLTGTIIEKIAPAEKEAESVETVIEMASTPTDESAPPVLTPESANQYVQSEATTPEEAEVSNESTPNDVDSNPQKMKSATDSTPHNDKYIVRFSLPAERNFNCKPNMTADISISRI